MKIGQVRMTFDGIQYLRAVAAIMVVVHHSRHFFGEVPTWTNFGSTGVAIFFVISGFIMVHATRDLDSNGNRFFQAIDFSVKRIIRIVPLYWLALIYQNKRAIFTGNWEPGLFLDFLFIPRYNERFSTEIWPSLILGWTINYEILFYALFAAAILFGTMRYVVLVSSLLILVLMGHFFDFNAAPAKFWTRNVVGEFAIGMFVYWLVKNKNWSPSNLCSLAIFLIGMSGLAIGNVYGIPSLFVYGPFAGLIVWSGVYLGRAVKTQSWLVKLGDASYSIYLTHMFTFLISDKVLRIAGFSEPTAINIALVLVAQTLVAIGIGVIVHRYVEKFMLDFLNEKWRNVSKFGLKASPA